MALQVKPIRLSVNGSVDSKVFKGPFQNCFLLSKIIDPQNVGAIIRSAAFFGLDHVFLTRDCSAITPTVSKASAGTLEYMVSRGCISHIQSTGSFLDNAVSQGWRTIAAVGPKSNFFNDNFSDSSSINQSFSSNHRIPTTLDKLDVSGPPKIVVLGGEGSGLSSYIQNKCVEHLCISSRNFSTNSFQNGVSLDANPSIVNLKMIPGLDSLNVSAAAATIAFHLTKQSLSSYR